MTTEIAERTLQQKRKYLHKEPKSFNLSHEAYLLFKKIAEERHLGIGDFFEVLAQEEAARTLAPQARQDIKEQAKAITRNREQEIEELEQSLESA